MKPHAFINVVIPFDSRMSAAANAFIESLADRSQGNYPNQVVEDKLSRVRGLHFMTLTVIDPLCPAELDADPDRAPPSPPPDARSHLLFEISSDVGAKALIADLADRFGDELSGLLTAAGLTKPATELAAFLGGHEVVIGDTWGSTLGQVFTGSPE